MVAITLDKKGFNNSCDGRFLWIRQSTGLICLAGAALVILINTVANNNNHNHNHNNNNYSHDIALTRGTQQITGIPASNAASIRGAGGIFSQTTTSSTSYQNKNNLQCRFFLAESAIPNGGLGLYTAIDIAKGEQAQSMPDVCIYVADTPDGTQFETHSWARDVFMGTFEGKNPRGACEGFATLFNSMPDHVSTSKLVSMKMHTNAGLERSKHAGAGAITHYYGITSEAIRNIPAGSELTINYGDWEYEDSEDKYTAPVRSLEWLYQHGICIDNIEIKQSTHPEMGRGAFARRAMKKGTIVAPAPLQTFPHRKAFGKKEPEALFVNYCLQPKGTDILLFPYGPGVNMINHSSHSKPNVALRWSTSPQHHHQWLDLPLEQFWQVSYPGALILEVVALRNIAQGEELYMDYGPEWETAWRDHVKHWKPVKGAKDYVYPADMDASQPFRTIQEQEKNPYPKNLATVCFENNWDIKKGRPIKWTQPEWWPEGMAYCHVLKREKDPKTNSWLYDVSLGFGIVPHSKDDMRYVDTKVPQSAIMFIDLPYKSDMHLPNAFRHPIRLPDHLWPSQWQN